MPRRYLHFCSFLIYLSYESYSRSPKVYLVLNKKYVSNVLFLDNLKIITHTNIIDGRNSER